MPWHNLQSGLENAPFVDTTTATGIINVEPHGKIFGWGDTVPADASTGWGKGALFIHTDGTTNNTLVYVNSGDTTSSTFTTLANVSIDAAQSYGGASNTLAPMVLSAATQSDSDDFAVSITSYATNVTTTSATDGTLADGSQVGQMKRVQLVVDAGNWTLTPSNLAGTDATITFADVGDVAELMWNGTVWCPIALYNAASGDAGPALG